MSRPLRTATADDEVHLYLAHALLADARDYAKRAHAPKATAAIRRALKSLEGAQRHAARARQEHDPINQAWQQYDADCARE